jgi:hypothetical protein
VGEGIGVSVGTGEGVGDGSGVAVGGIGVGVVVGSAGESALQPVTSSASTTMIEIVSLVFIVVIYLISFVKTNFNHTDRRVILPGNGLKLTKILIPCSY